MSDTPLPRRRGSLRLRILIGNVAALAAVLAALGLGFRWTLQRQIIAATDREIAAPVDRMLRSWQEYTPEQRRTLLLLLRARPLGGISSLLGLPRMGRLAALAGVPIQVQPESGSENAAPQSGGSSAAADPPLYPWRLLDPQGKSLVFRTALTPWDADAFQRSLHGETCFTTAIRPDGDTIRIYSVPALDSDGKVQVVVQAARSLRPTLGVLMATDHVLLGFLPVALAAAGAVGALLTGRALAPVGRFSRAAARIEAADLSERLPVEGADEFADLAQVINGMLARLECAFEQQRRFTADASHGLRSPLTVILGQASLALSGPQSDDNRRAWERTARSARAMEQLIHDLLTLARSDAHQLEIERAPIPVCPLLETAVEMTPESERRAGAAIVCECPEGLQALGDADHLARALHNLIANALRHTPPDGGIILHAAPVAGSQIAITVTDSGTGIAPEHLPHVQERFYRADHGRARSAGGTGLGLAIVQTVVAAHGGNLQISSTLGRGTTVRMTLPAAANP